MSTKADILVVDDEHNTLASLSRAFRMAGHAVSVTDDANRALELALTNPFDLILSDVVMPRRDGLSLLEELRARGVTAPVVMMSGQAHIEMAVKATRLGALDFLEKPISTDKLLLTVENALRLRRLQLENTELRRRVGSQEIIWAGETMRRVMSLIDRVGPTQSRVCIQGETGTGKELVARTLHERSTRAQQAFITLNCAAVPAELIESELFGHEKGSFTGATQRYIGKFEQAHHGTLFLDEIGDMPLAMQSKLLRVLEGSEVERIGGGKPVPVDVRVVVATHRDLEALVRGASFREDLFHRIYVFPIRLPSLRERREDIPVLIRHFREQLATQNGWRPVPFSEDVIAALSALPWPGNIRELRNTIERLQLLAEGEVTAATLEQALPRGSTSPLATADEPAGTLAEQVSAFERSVIRTELQRNGRHITNTARSLGLERSHFYKKCSQLNITLRPDGPRVDESHA